MNKIVNKYFKLTWVIPNVGCKGVISIAENHGV